MPPRYTDRVTRPHDGTKAPLRRWMKHVRAAMPPVDRARASAAATEHLLAVPELDVEVVSCFVSFGDEIDTRPLIARLLASGRVVGVPRVEDGRLSCHRLRSLDDLVAGAHGILTSDGEDLGGGVGFVVTPGLAFSPQGDRLGYGAGYYDRYLADRPDVAAVGLGFEWQVLAEIPHDERDAPLRAIATDCGVHRGVPPRAIRVVGGAIVRDGRVLVARRARGSLAGWWELPGGKVEPDETEPEALIRELREELEIEVVVGEPLALTIHPYPDVEVALAAWICEIVDREPRPSDHDQLAWLGPDALWSIGWAPADIPLIPPLIRYLRG